MSVRNLLLSCLVLIGTILIKTNSACGVFDVKKTCECQSTYTMSADELVEKPFILVPSKDDCGPYLGCSLNQNNACKKYCIESINKVLGGAPTVNERGLENICSLVAE